MDQFIDDLFLNGSLRSSKAAGSETKLEEVRHWRHSRGVISCHQPLPVCFLTSTE